ncbi:alkaline phosphatase [Neiella marina]|uniref:Alkaline phosphatase n=1 Tax=Neiella holothuriorum TaxID=2870530 RepID=A0ABS7EDX7_9GAMM|nr:alkaline phosphatase [Neiella holothuriorum]MBW8190533.1 alkaline phosphatase [Neiella holothuriorum]
MRLMTTVAFTSALCSCLSACQLTTTHEVPSKAIAPAPLSQAADTWYQAGQDAVEQARQRQIDNRRGAAKNIILFVGDGMGISTITASRILAGQQRGLKGEEYNLSWDEFPYSGLVKTYNTNQQTPDSAGTMTAMMTGVKSKAGFIGVSETVARGDCQQYLAQGEPLVTALELAKLAGKKTGVVSTARITHATPAATYAKSPERGWESDADFDNNEAELGCVDIARQLIEFPQTFAERFGVNQANPQANTIDVVFGGGRRAFYGSDPADLTQFAQQANQGKRKDNRNLIADWQQQGGLYVSDRQAMNLLTSQTTKPVLGLFNPSHMRYEADRSGNSQEPSLTDMTNKAIELLANDEQGYFLMVEAGRIDHGHHAGSAYNALTDAVELSQAVAEALRLTDPSETLIIVTADHSHVMTMSGYPTRGNPILGKVVGNDKQGNPTTKPTLALDGLPYTTLGYYNGRGHTHVQGRTNAGLRYKEPVFAGRHDLCEIETTDSGFHQEALVPLKSETHGGEDVGVYANGPGAHLLSGTIEQNVIFHVMNHVADLSGQAQQQLQAQH